MPSRVTGPATPGVPNTTPSRSVMGALFGRMPEMVEWDGKGFRMLNKSDFEGRPVYFHSGDIKLEQ